MASFDYNTAPLDEMEDVRGVFYGGPGQWGQQFVVTNRRFLLGPLDVGLAETIDEYTLDHVAAGAGELLKSVLANYAPRVQTALWLRHIVDVHATNDASLFKPPGIRITTDTDQMYEIGIVATPTTANIGSKNNAVRDRAVAVFTAAIAEAKAAPVKTP